MGSRSGKCDCPCRRIGGPLLRALVPVHTLDQVVFVRGGQVCAPRVTTDASVTPAIDAREAVEKIGGELFTIVHRPELVGALTD